MFNTVEILGDGTVRFIDQRKLPTEEVFVDCADCNSVYAAIKDMVVRGAPAIGVAAAAGVSVGANCIDTKDIPLFKKEIHKVCDHLVSSRPTAVNLFWAIERMRNLVANSSADSVSRLKKEIAQEAAKVLKEDREINKKMAYIGAELIEDGDVILTHCNAGALATSGEYGTALGVIKAAHEQGKKIEVYADETRPFLQGARLTAWELVKEGIRANLITDNMAGYFMNKGVIKKIIVGADRIAANGDTANKIGTYSLSVLAKEHNISLYIVAPLSTIDINIPDGSHIQIEERPDEEVTHIKGIRVAPEGINIKNPAFDVTPNNNIAAIVTEKGIIRAPFDKGIKDLFSK